VIFNTIYYGDNLSILKNHIKDESIDLIYLDPPYNKKRPYNIIHKDELGRSSDAQITAFEDTWHWTPETQKQFDELIDRTDLAPEIRSAMVAFREMLSDADIMAYLVMMTTRLVELHRVLKPTGSIYLHCDPTASHYLKIIMDIIFDKENFQNEIIWCYRTGGATKKRFSRKHDTILFYSKTDKFFYNSIKERVFYNKKFFDTKVDDIGRYYSDVLPVDWWQIKAVINVSRERTEYPTQKPEALLEKIIKASCPKDGIILDPFAGCFTTSIVAEKLHRKWIGIDITYLGINVLLSRLKKMRNLQSEEGSVTYEIIGEPVDMYGVQKLVEQSEHEFAIWAITRIGGKPKKQKSRDKGVDGFKDFFDGGKPKRALVQATCQMGSCVSKLRDFCHVVNRDKSPIGIFITMKEPTRDMISEAAKEGVYTDCFTNTYQKIQIITVKQILAGEKGDIPSPRSEVKK